MSKVTMWRSRWRCVIKPAYSVSFLLSINIFVWQNVLYFLDAPRTYKTLSNILLSRLTWYAGEINGDHQCGFNITDQLMTMHSAFNILNKKWEYNGPIHQLYRFVGSLRLSWEESSLQCSHWEWEPTKLGLLIKQYWNWIDNEVKISNNFSDKSA